MEDFWLGLGLGFGLGLGLGFGLGLGLGLGLEHAARASERSMLLVLLMSTCGCTTRYAVRMACSALVSRAARFSVCPCLSLSEAAMRTPYAQHSAWGPVASCPEPSVRTARRRLVRVARAYSREAPS
eukprot:scaffold114739_cov70-Phaeocystis_antarctica.AAC.2